MGLDLGDLAYAAVRVGQYSKAEAYARRALSVGTEIYPHIVLAEALARQGRAAEASAVCEEAAAVAKATGGPGIFARVHYIRGLAAAAGGDVVEAEAHLRHALEVMEQYPRLYLQAQVYEEVGDLYGPRDNAKAVGAYGKAIEIYERIGAPRSPARVRAKIEALEGGR